MAFHMTPTGRKKDSYSSFQKRGLLNSPVKQVKTKEELDAEAKEIAQLKDWEKNEEGRLYRSAETEDNTIDSSDKDKPKMSNEDWIKFKVDYEKKHGEPWTKPGSKNTGSYIEFKDEDPDKGKKDYEVQSLATFLSNKGVYQAKDMYTTVQKADGSGFEKRLKNEDELKSDLAYHDDGEGLMQEWRDHVGGYTAKDATMDISKNVVKGTLSKEDSDQPDLSNASDKTLYDAPVEQLSPVRKLMNRYMPKKSMAKQTLLYPNDDKFTDALNFNKIDDVTNSSDKDNSIVGYVKTKKDKKKNKKFLKKHKKSITKQGKKEEVIGDDGKPIKGPIGSEYVVHADRSKGGYGEMTSIDGKKVTKSSRQSDVYFEKYRP